MGCLEAFSKSENSMVLTWDRRNFASDSKGKEAPAWLPPVPVIIWPQDWKRHQMFTS